MFMGVEHGGYIFASYLFAFLILAGVILWVRINLSTQKNRLKELEESGAAKRRRRPSKGQNNA